MSEKSLEIQESIIPLIDYKEKQETNENIETISQQDFDTFSEKIKNNESEVWAEVLDNRSVFEQNYKEMFEKIDISSTNEAREKAFSVVNRALDYLKNILNLENFDPGHGIGHMKRDIDYATILSADKKINPKHLYIGIIAGCLHDILGCSILERYDEKNRSVRHAEVGGLLYKHISKNININDNEALLVFYAISAHTHFLKEMPVTCSDDVEREIKPYVDTDDNNEPIMAIWLTRWIDRLDASGPCFVGRHFLTQYEKHHDYSAEHGFFPIEFKAHMRPILRDSNEIGNDQGGQTMLEHLNMFAGSQNNNSPFGLHDQGKMIELRDYNRDSLLRIIDAYKNEKDLSNLDEKVLLLKWFTFLKEKIEPSLPGSIASERLEKMFEKLPVSTKKIWFNIFDVTMNEYDEWENMMKVQKNNARI